MNTAAPILYVEDEENDVVLVKLAFKRAGIQSALRIAIDGREALDYVDGIGQFADRVAHPLPCIILLDLNLPKCDGFEVLETVRRQFDENKLPVIIFTSSEQNSDKEKARRLRANDYIVKPSSATQLVVIAAALKLKWFEGENSPR